MTVTTKTAISLPNKIFKDATRLAEKRGLSRSALIADALRTYLQDERRSRMTKDYDAYAASYDTSMTPIAKKRRAARLRRLPW